MQLTLSVSCIFSLKSNMLPMGSSPFLLLQLKLIENDAAKMHHLLWPGGGPLSGASAAGLKRLFFPSPLPEDIRRGQGNADLAVAGRIDNDTHHVSVSKPSMLPSFDSFSFTVSHEGSISEDKTFKLIGFTRKDAFRTMLTLSFAWI